MSAQESIATTKNDQESEAKFPALSRDRKLAAAQVAWIFIAAIEIGLFSLSLPARWQQLNNPSPQLSDALTRMQISPSFFATYNVGLETLFALSFSLVALIILRRKWNDLTAVLISMMLLTFGSSAYPLILTTNALADLHPEWLPIVRLMIYATWVLVFLFFCIFPDGRFVPKWSRLFFVFTALISIPWNLWPDSAASPWTWPAPVLLPFDLLVWGTCVYIQIYRFRHVSNRIQQQQTKWVVFGLFVSVAGVLGFYLPRAIDPALANPTTPETATLYMLSSTVICLSALLTPIAIAISILRYRLWEIDLLISRTLVYVPLTAILAGLYTASITLFQRLFGAFTGNKSDTAIVISTLILASLFTPIKNSLQSVVDRRFKKSEDPHERLQAFRNRVQSVVEVLSYRRMAERLVTEACAAFGCKGGAVYLGDKNDLHLLYSSEGWDGEQQLTVPLRSHGIKLGMVVLGAREDGKEYSKQDRETLKSVVEVVADAVMLEGQAA